MFKNSHSLSAKELEFELKEELSWDRYFMQYKYSVDVLVSKLENGEKVFNLVFPILNMVRHSLEIGLKMNIKLLEKLNGIEKKYDNSKTNHSLEALFNLLKDHFNWVFDNHHIGSKIQNEIITFMNKTNKLKHILIRLDHSAQEFRYPNKKNGQTSFEDVLDIDLKEILDYYYETTKFLIYTEDVLYEEGLFLDWNDFN